MLLTRYLKKDHLSEDMTRRKQAADLIAHMRALGVEMNEVNAVLAAIGRKPNDQIGAVARVKSPEEEVEAREIASIESATSQAEMNMLQASRAERLDGRMQSALQQLRAAFGEDFLKELNDSQAAWEAYREAESKFSGAPWVGGTMMPFVVSGAFARLTKERIQVIENHLEIFKATQSL
jgi:uncharacterized protein YecT (DUF1311 family)